jgi:hypothetical protein
VQERITTAQAALRAQLAENATLENKVLELERGYQELVARNDADAQAYNTRKVQVEHVKNSTQALVGRFVDQVAAGHELHVRVESDQRRSVENEQATKDLAAQLTALEQQTKKVRVCVPKSMYML